MLETLLESAAPPRHRRASAAASVAIHTALIVGAIVATASARPGHVPPVVPPDAGLIYLPPIDAAGPRSASRLSPERRVAHPGPEAVLNIPALSVDFDQVTIEPDIDIHRPGFIGVDTALRTARRELVHAAGSGSPGEMGDEPMTSARVDRAATILVPPRPRYPEPLRAAGVTGRVLVRLVVDTTGRVEPATTLVLEASHDLFAQAVRAVLPSVRFAPAEAGGRKVRVLVDLPFEFRLHE